MRAIMVAVDYCDILSLTLPLNLHHFSQVVIVTSRKDMPNVLQVAGDVHNVRVIATDLFYADGAIFNKFRALEWGLDQMGRYGWICHLDADVVWPRMVDMSRYLRRGYLYCPLRRICDPIPQVVPPESEWEKYPLHAQFKEWAGYSQIYHAEDVRLGKPPWHPIDLTTAGTGDSFFQAKWPTEYKVRPPFTVLHLGKHGCNWAGRATPYLDGTSPPESSERISTVRNLIRSRGSGPDRFANERITIKDALERPQSDLDEMRQG